MNKRYIVPFGELKNVMYRPSKAKSTLQGKKQTRNRYLQYQMSICLIIKRHSLNDVTGMAYKALSHFYPS